MAITIQKKPAFVVAGVLLEAVDNSQCPSAWDNLYGTYRFEELEGLGNGQPFGICIDKPDKEGITYVAGYDVTDKTKAEALGLSIMEIAETDYAIIPVKGPIPESIHQAWKYAFEVFLPETGYRHANTPDLEVYSEGNPHDPNYEMELWLPVVK